MKIIKIVIGALFIFLGFTFIVVTEYLIKNYGLISIEQYLFHLLVPLEGSNNSMIYEGINYCLPLIIKYSLITYAVIYLLVFGIRKKWNLNFDLKLKGKKFKITIFPPLSFLKRFFLSCCTIFVVISLVINANSIGLVDYIYSITQKSAFFEEYYVNPTDVELTFPEEKQNLIFIQLESMESTYSSIENGGAFEMDLIPELTELAFNNISFSDTEALGGFETAYGAGWTIGGMVAQTSGIPLKVSIGGNEYGEYSNFLPNNVSLGEILEEEGYNNYFLLGSEAAFAGRDKYFEQHGNYTIYDYNTAIEEGWIEEDYFVWWGYEDNKLIEFAKEQLTEISQQEEPFNFHMLTVDTHPTEGYLDDNAPIIYDEQYYNVLSYSSTIISEFVAWIQEQPFYENTVIIITGDHANMELSLFEGIDSDYQRKVYNVFINSEATTDNTKNRVFTTYDIFPSVLASMGVEIEGDRLGLGVNLFSDEPTLAEEFGLDYLSDELSKKSTYYDNRFIYDKKQEV